MSGSQRVFKPCLSTFPLPVRLSTVAEAGLGSLFSDVVRFVVWADPSLVIWFTYGLLNVFWSHGTKSEHLGLGLWWELILFPVYVCVWEVWGVCMVCVYVWSVFLRGKAANAYHVYQVSACVSCRHHSCEALVLCVLAPFVYVQELPW